MLLQKTEKARLELSPGVRTLSLRERSLLLLADGKPLSDLQAMYNGIGAQIVENPKQAIPMKMIGHVTSSYWSENCGRSIAMALVAGGRDRIGETLYVPMPDKVIEVVNARPGNLVCLLWGSHAQSKQKLIDTTRHLVLKSAHPSPLSAYRGFLGNGHFSRTNQYLKQCGLTPIDWRLPPLPA